MHGAGMNWTDTRASYILALDFAYSSEQAFANVIG
jgi:hypothetical protein